MVTYQLQVRCRSVKVRRSETDVLPLSHTTEQTTDVILNSNQARGNHISTGGQGQISPVRHKRGINILAPISNFTGSVDPPDPDFPRP